MIALQGQYSEDLRAFDHRLLLRRLAQEKDPEIRRRLRVVALLEARSLSWPIIYARTGIPRSTAYGLRWEFRKHGLPALLQSKRAGRPITIPPIVRERFEYLCRKDPEAIRHEVLYVIERELVVFRILQSKFSCRQLTRWYRCLAKEHNLGDRFLVFRRMRRAFQHLRPRETWCFGGIPPPKTPRDFKRVMRIDALEYASDRNPRDRELMRRAISAKYRIPLSKIAFGDEPHFHTADYAWGAIPEKLEPVDIFALWLAKPEPSLLKTSSIADPASVESRQAMQGHH